MSDEPATTGTTIRLPEDLLADARGAAAGRNESFNRFVAWAIRQALRLEFLSPQNRAFILKIAAELERPWDALAIVNLLVSAARGEARAQKLLHIFFERNDSLRSFPNLSEPPHAAGQLPIEFSQKQSAAAAGEASPSPRKAEASPANPRKGATRG